MVSWAVPYPLRRVIGVVLVVLMVLVDRRVVGRLGDTRDTEWGLQKHHPLAKGPLPHSMSSLKEQVWHGQGIYYNARSGYLSGHCSILPAGHYLASGRARGEQSDDTKRYQSRFPT
jgi:hypothetical protein